jgi:TolB-like protein
VVAVLALLIAITAGVAYLRSSGKTPIDSIVVLPFANRSGDAGLEDLGDDIAASLTTDLINLKRFRVVPTSTALRYKGQSGEWQKIAREQQARAVLLGRIDKRGDNLIIVTELIDVENNSQLCCEPIKSNQPDIIGAASALTLQKVLSQQIMDMLKARLSIEGQK